MTNGARLMLSTPPATMTSPSPQVTACAAIDDRVEAAAAIALQHRAGDLDRQSGEQPGMARDAAAVLARLVGAADDDILDLLRVEAGFA